ncbi:MAG: hypothetical protein K6E30_05990 [Lachnospiraceae bacterium]|nr:hypothetical protein [Lachnospiraceae bacterium]
MNRELYGRKAGEKESYELIAMEILEFEMEDVIATSGVIEGGESEL